MASGQYRINPHLFKRGGTLFKRGYIALDDIPEAGIRAGQEVSRHKAIKISRLNPLPPVVPKGVLPTTGKLAVNPNLFERGGVFARGYIARVDMPEFGLRAGQAVSRRRAIEISQGGKRIEELVQPIEMNTRRETLQQLWEMRYGTRRGFRQFLGEMDSVYSTLEPGLPIGRRGRRIEEGWEAIMKKYDIWDTYQEHRNAPLGRSVWESDPTLLDFDYSPGVVIRWD